MPNYNTTTTTGIPFGTVYLNELDSDLGQTLIDNAKDSNYHPALLDYASNEGWIDLSDWTFEHERDYEDFLQADEWLEDHGKLGSFHDSYEQSYGDYTGEYENVKYRISEFGGAMLLWVIESAHYQEYRACSPCVPGAHSISTDEPVFTELSDTVSMGYCVPQSWFWTED